jgi:hypothetical protein
MEGAGGESLGVFIGLTVILVGGAAALAGRAIAESWKPAWQAVLAAFGLTLANRFLVYALFGGDLLSVRGLLVDFAVVLVLALVAWRITRASKLVRQYPWKYQRRSLFSSVEKDAA